MNTTSRNRTRRISQTTARRNQPATKPATQPEQDTTLPPLDLQREITNARRLTQMEQHTVSVVAHRLERNRIQHLKAYGLWKEEENTLPPFDLTKELEKVRRANEAYAQTPAGRRRLALMASRMKHAQM